MKIYSYTAVDGLIDRYIEKGGCALQTSQGCLASGDWILYGEGLYTFIVKEIYLNEWSSGHTIRKYRKTPAKYQTIIDGYESGDLEMIDGVLQAA